MSTRQRTQRCGRWLDLAFLTGREFKALDGLGEVRRSRTRRDLRAA